MQYLGLISAKVAVGDNKGAYRIFKIAISIFGLIGFIGTVILFLNAKLIANSYLGIPEAEMTIIALAPSVFIVSVLAVLRGYFNGRERIKVTANSQSLEQVIKTALTFFIVEIFSYISKNNTSMMSAGVTIASTLSTFFSFGYLYISYIRNKKEIWKDVVTSVEYEKESIIRIIRNIMYVFIPIALTSLLGSCNRSIDAFTIVNTISKFMPNEEAKLQYGILTGKVESLIVLPYSFNIAFATSLIPSISASQATGETIKAIQRIEFSILATILITLPCTGIFLTFAEPILKLLFPNAYLGKTMLKLCSISIVFVAITQTIGGVLQGLKKVKEPAIAIGVGAIVKLILNLILLPIERLNINGAIIATIISHIVVFGISFYYLKKYVSINFGFLKFVIKPIIATVVMITASYFIYTRFFIINSQNIRLIIALAIGVGIYIMLIWKLRILSNEEILMLPYANKLVKNKNAKTQ